MIPKVISFVAVQKGMRWDLCPYRSTVRRSWWRVQLLQVVSGGVDVKQNNFYVRCTFNSLKAVGIDFVPPKVSHLMCGGTESKPNMKIHFTYSTAS